MSLIIGGDCQDIDIDTVVDVGWVYILQRRKGCINIGNGSGQLQVGSKLAADYYIPIVDYIKGGSAIGSKGKGNIDIISNPCIVIGDGNPRDA